MRGESPRVWRWTIALLVVVTAASAAAAAVAVAQRNAADPPSVLFDAPAQPLWAPSSSLRTSQTSTGNLPTVRGPLRLAGSGSNLALTRALADAYETAHPDARVLVHASIGSTGGVRAVRDGAVDLGLTSRPLRDEERAGSLTAIPYARVPVVVAVNRSVQERALSRAELVALFSGERERWADGSSAVVLLREAGDSSHAVFTAAWPELDEAARRARAEGRWPVRYTDADMESGLVATLGAVGLFDLGAIRLHRLPLRALSVDGHSPSRSESYPFWKELAFVVDGEAAPRVRAFLGFVASPAGAAVIREAGYRPVSGGSAGGEVP